jgi:hypothetical protein
MVSNVAVSQTNLFRAHALYKFNYFAPSQNIIDLDASLSDLGSGIKSIDVPGVLNKYNFWHGAKISVATARQLPTTTDHDV